MPKHSRPLSPHLQVYRPQITSVLSITHRGTGVLLALGGFGLVYWLLALANGPGTYATAQAFFSSWLGQLLLLGWSFALFYHLCNGIRHLFWDAGRGFDLEAVSASGKAVVVVSILMTLLTWMIAFAMRGGAA